MRDDLDSPSQIITAPFLTDYISINTTCGEIVFPGHGRIYKTLIMTQIQIGFRPILGDKHLTVLKGAHGAGINVDVWIKFKERDREPLRFKNSP